MANITISQGTANEGSPTAIAIPVPARIRNKKSKNPHLEVSQNLLKKYKLSAERYKEISSKKEEFDNGEIHIVRDADFGNLDLANSETSTDEIIKRIENHGRLIIFLPIKTREDKDITNYVYLSALRALAKLILSNPELIEQFKIINIPVFPTLTESIPKIEEVFKEIDIEIFVCLGTKDGDIL
jgi:hypothetical protein